jgi:hypothetical protein
MAAGTPLNRLTLSAASVADDLGYVALSDLARVLGDASPETVTTPRWPDSRPGNASQPRLPTSVLPEYEP